LFAGPLKGQLMTEMSDWFQNNWIDLARLLVQCAILATVVRYGRKLLATLRASQEQVGALLKLSVSDTAAEQRTQVSESRERYAPPSLSVREPELEPEAEPEPEPVFAGGFSREGYAGDREQSLGGRLAGSPAPVFSTRAGAAEPAVRAESPSLTPWVSAPGVAAASEPERLNTHTAPSSARPSASSWLQAPMQRSGVSPWRKAVRWLQAPVRR
jgi:hypothetical protein